MPMVVSGRATAVAQIAETKMMAAAQMAAFESVETLNFDFIMYLSHGVQRQRQLRFYADGDQQRQRGKLRRRGRAPLSGRPSARLELVQVRLRIRAFMYYIYALKLHACHPVSSSFVDTPPRWLHGVQKHLSEAGTQSLHAGTRGQKN